MSKLFLFKSEESQLFDSSLLLISYYIDKCVFNQLKKLKSHHNVVLALMEAFFKIDCITQYNNGRRGPHLRSNLIISFSS